MEEDSFSIKELYTITDNKLISAALGPCCLVVGDERGKLISFDYEISNNNTSNFKLCETFAIPKGKPEKIIISPSLNIAYVLVNGEVHVFSLPKLQKLFELKHKETIIAILIDSSNKIEAHNLMVITKKKRIRIFNFEPSTNTLNERQSDKVVSIDCIPEHYQWYDNTLCYSYKNKLYWYNSTTNTNEYRELDGIKGIQYCNQLMVYTDNALILGMNSCDEYLKVSIKDKPIDFCEIKGYLIGIHNIDSDSSITVYSHGGGVQNYNINQSLTLTQGEKCKFIICNTNQIMCINTQGTNYNIVELVEKDIEVVLNELLHKEKYNEALNKINNCFVTASEDKINLIHKFYLDVSWCALNKGNFKIAGELAQITNSNPLEYIYIFADLLYIKTSKDALNSSKEMHSMISQITSLRRELLNDAYEFLLSYLKNKRSSLLSKYDYKKDANKDLSFHSSEHSKLKIDVSKDTIKLIEMLNVINTTIIKLMIILQVEDPTEMALIFEHPSCSVQGNFDLERDGFYFSTKDNAWATADVALKYKESNHYHLALAYFYEKKNYVEKALSEWKELITKHIHALDSIIVIEGKERIRRIFKRLYCIENEKSQNLFMNYIKWIIDIFPEYSFKNVIEASTTKMPSGQMFFSINLFEDKILANKEKEKPELNLREMFLEFYNKYSPNEHYQTKLLELYIDKLFSMFDSKMEQNKVQSQFNNDARKYYALFMEVLKLKDACYKKKYILEKIRNSWLKQAEIYLLSELHSYNEVLDMFIEQIEIKKKKIDESEQQQQQQQQSVTVEDTSNISSNSKIRNVELFKPIEMFCNINIKNKKDLFTDLFLKILQKYKDTNNNYKQLYKDELLNLLTKHGSIEKIDFLKVLENIPDDFNTCDKDFHSYLTKSIQDYIQLANTIKFENEISEMALLYKEKELYETKDKGVIIDTNTVCDLCKKKIGSNIFVFYPNMRIYHSNCVNNYNICPVTGIDFNKRNYII